MEQIRAFIAIELSQEIQLALTRLQNKLKSGSDSPVRWVDPDNIHLTLKFLGDIDTSITGTITNALIQGTSGITSFQLELRSLGVFPNSSRVRVIWVGLEGDTKHLDRLQKSVESALSSLGFSTESRPFTPHLTLGRVGDNARPDERQSLGRLIECMKFESGAGLDVKAIHLIKSQLTPQGPIYTKISTIELK